MRRRPAVHGRPSTMRAPAGMTERSRFFQGHHQRAQVDAVQRYASPEEERGKIEAQVMTLEARVVGEDFVRGEAVGGAAQGAGLAGQHHGGEADAVGLEVALEGGPVVGGGDEVAAVGDQRAHFFGHAAAEFGVSAAEGDDYGFGAFAEEAEDRRLLHRVDLVNQRTAQAARGVKATATVTGAYPWRSISLPIAGPRTVEIAP